VSRHPSLTRPLRALIADVAARLPEFAHLRATRILVVAGEARRTSHASIRPMSRQRAKAGPASPRVRPRIRIRGRTILYVITLRPLWFRSSTPEGRVATLLHELFHISTRFDGTLHAGRRHEAMGRRFDLKLRPLVRRYLQAAPPEIVAPFAHVGLVRVSRWVEKPPASFRPDSRRGRHARRLYTEDQLFLGLERMLRGPVSPRTR
jgi:hypothetical protein